MIQYQYQIIRYRHDLTTGEFVNIGVIAYSEAAAFLDCSVLSKYSRVTSFFNGADGRGVRRALEAMEKAIGIHSQDLASCFPPPPDIQSITSQVLPKDDSALFLSDPVVGVDFNMNRCLSELFRIYVSRWQTEIETESESDSEIWKNKYKRYFDRYNITHRLGKVEIKTRNDSFTFDKAWKNETWHCYEPLSFNLKNVESIKSKVYT